MVRRGLWFLTALLLILSLFMLIWRYYVEVRFWQGKDAFSRNDYCNAIQPLTEATTQAKSRDYKDPQIPFYTAANYAVILRAIPPPRPCGIEQPALVKQIEYYYEEMWKWARENSNPDGDVSRLFAQLSKESQSKCQALVDSLPGPRVSSGETCVALPPYTPLPSPPPPSPTPANTTISGSKPTSQAINTPARETVIVTVTVPVTVPPGLTDFELSLTSPREDHSMGGGCRGLVFEWSYPLKARFRISFYRNGQEVYPDPGGETEEKKWQLSQALDNGHYEWQVFVLDDKKRPVQSSEKRKLQCYNPLTD